MLPGRGAPGGERSAAAPAAAGPAPSTELRAELLPYPRRPTATRLRTRGAGHRELLLRAVMRLLRVAPERRRLGPEDGGDPNAREFLHPVLPRREVRKKVRTWTCSGITSDAAGPLGFAPGGSHGAPALERWPADSPGGSRGWGANAACGRIIVIALLRRTPERPPRLSAADRARTAGYSEGRDGSPAAEAAAGLPPRPGARRAGPGQRRAPRVPPRSRPVPCWQAARPLRARPARAKPLCINEC